MDELMYAAEVRSLLAPVFASMLRPRELRTLATVLVPLDGDRQQAEFAADDLVESNGAAVWWRICGEWGSSTIWLEDGPSGLTERVESDLQDFIAESRFGWGERRFPRTAAPRDSV